MRLKIGTHASVFLSLLLISASAWAAPSKKHPWTPLHAAAAKGDLPAASRLIARGANVNAVAEEIPFKNPIYLTPLHVAARAGRSEVARFLVSKGAKVNTKTNYGETPLLFAAQKDPSLALFLLSKGAAANARNIGNRTPLHAAAATGHVPLVRALISRGADVNVMNGYYDTPLHLAANAEVARLLLAKGARVNVKAKWGMSPLEKAFGRGPEGGGYRADVARLLIERGARIPIVNAVSSYDLSILQLLLSKGIPVDGRNEKGETALMVVAGYHDTPLPDNLARFEFGTLEGSQLLLRKRLETARFLIQKGANIEAKDRKGGTPLLRAALHGRAEMARLLLSKGAKHRAKDIYGYTPLHWAAGNNKPAAVSVLLQYGADVAARNKKGRTPLQLAQMGAKDASDQKGFKEIIQRLQQASKLSHL